MTTRVWIAIGVLVVVIAAAVLVVRSYGSAPLRQTGARDVRVLAPAPVGGCPGDSP